MESKSLISLGINCEASFQIKRKYAELDSFIFSWAWIPNEKCILNTINNINLIGSEGFKVDYNTGNMCVCNKTGMKFHGRKKISLLKNDVEIADFLQEVADRVAYLKRKFLIKVQGNDKKIFLFKRSEKISAPLENFAPELYTALKSINARNFDLVIISHKNYEAPPLDLPGVYNRYLERYSPYTNVADSCTTSWDRIFDEFLPISDHS